MNMNMLRRFAFYVFTHVSDLDKLGFVGESNVLNAS